MQNPTTKTASTIPPVVPSEISAPMATIRTRALAITNASASRSTSSQRIGIGPPESQCRLAQQAHRLLDAERRAQAREAVVHVRVELGGSHRARDRGRAQGRAERARERAARREQALRVELAPAGLVAFRRNVLAHGAAHPPA